MDAFLIAQLEISIRDEMIIILKRHKALPHLVGLLIIEWITIHSAKKYSNHLGAAWVHQAQVPHGIAASICLIDFSKCGVVT